MYNFILQLALMIGLGTMIYLFARAIPRVGDEVPESDNKLDKWISSLPLEKIDVSFGNFLEKVLRRVKLTIMKLDNAVGRRIDRLRRINGNGKKNEEEKPNLFNGQGKKFPE